MAKNIVGVVLAGGRSSRMGEDKSFIGFGGKPLIQHVIQRAASQVDDLVISTNHQSNRYQTLGLELGLALVADTAADFAGPLAGLLAAMDYVTKNRASVSHLATFPVDSPFYPEDLVKRLHQALESQQARIAIPRYQGQSHWAFGLWALTLADDLRGYLLEQQRRKVQTWIEQQSYCLVDFDDAVADPFFNINTPDELETATRRLKQTS